MSYRRRRGLGSPMEWVRSHPRPLGVAVGLLLLFGVGYLLATAWLFPATAAEESTDLVQVPELVGLTSEEARGSLDEAGLAFRLGHEVPHAEAAAGEVLAQSPLAGQYARPGAPVSVTLSLGSEQRRVPDLRGLSGDQGRIVLERLGFEVATDSTGSPVERGRVVGTRPGTGEELTLPAEVTLVLSHGPAVVEVPDLDGVHVDDVRGRLDEAGLALGEVRYDSAAYAAPGRVVGQSPSPGYALRVGGRVSVRVAGRRPTTDAESGGGG